MIEYLESSQTITIKSWPHFKNKNYTITSQSFFCPVKFEDAELMTLVTLKSTRYQFQILKLSICHFQMYLKS